MAKLPAGGLIYSVILSQPDEFNLEKIAKIIAAYKNVPLFDTRIMARHSLGFLGEGLSESDARLIVSFADEEGVKTVLLEDEKVAALPKPALVTSADCGQDGFSFTAASGGPVSKIPWKDICLFCAVCLKEESSSLKTVKQGRSQTQKIMSIGILMSTGIPIKIGKDKQITQSVTEKELHFFADIFFKSASDPVQRLHIEAERIDFSYLGPRKLPNTAGNFNLLVRDIASRAGLAILNKGMKMLLAGQPLAAVGYDSSDDYEKECRWLLTLAESKFGTNGI